jgi:hypothetical protein
MSLLSFMSHVTVAQSSSTPVGPRHSVPSVSFVERNQRYQTPNVVFTDVFIKLLEIQSVVLVFSTPLVN